MGREGRGGRNFNPKRRQKKVTVLKALTQSWLHEVEQREDSLPEQDILRNVSCVPRLVRGTTVGETAIDSVHWLVEEVALI